ncbi:hypothetical protein [Variovorax sp. YR752]|uniref:hypothetical protein n=1 Tax=Variovorax sp. YR752 TaxID=1884383 RepID=UPI00313835E2
MNANDNVETLLRVLAAPRRNQYFYGKRMDVQHFRMEQDYGRLKQALMNRLTLGKGVLCGLRVTIDDGRLCVEPGVAVDGLGREIVVPVRSCVDPAAPGMGCCAGSVGEAQQVMDGLCFFTLWACYRECGADYQPALVAECGTHADCAAGTSVETFCFKITPGLAPLQADPRWCLPQQSEPAPDAEPGSQPGLELPPGFAEAGAAGGAPARQALLEALGSRRHLLCEVVGRDCETADGDPCVPLAAGVMSDNTVLAVENCLVRPRIYSNEVLLDLILCLAQRIDDCCNETPQSLMRVTAVEFLHRGAAAGEAAVGHVQSALEVTHLPIGARTNAIRITFSRPFDQAQHRPTTAGTGDANFERHNVLVVPVQPLQNQPYVAGTLALESPQVVRFDLADHTVYSRGPQLGWQKGRYRILLAGSDAAASGRRALTDLAGVALDGEPANPMNGSISGDGTAGGDFVASFVVG